ncbi:hypothetical protein B0H19DRAFT_903159, partial [Mycena capillaripes]
RFPQPRCHPETRTKLLDVIWDWAGGLQVDRPSSGILWLYGPAGAGKSAIALSFCENLKEKGRLYGSFFFKRGHSSCGNARKLFPTLAYQLAFLHTTLKQHISQMIENDPTIVDRSLSDQLYELIVEPCRKTSFPQPVTIIIDTYEGQQFQQEVLWSIGQVASQEHIPILFFIASRPESHIREAFAGPGLNAFHRPLNIDQSFQDVRKYL